MAPSCTLCKVPYGGVSTLHKLPTNVTAKKEWIKYLRQSLGDTWNPPKQSSIRVCSQHFEDDSYLDQQSRLKLNPLAVPTLPYEKENQDAKSESSSSLKRKSSPRKMTALRLSIAEGNSNVELSPMKKKQRQLFGFKEDRRISNINCSDREDRPTMKAPDGEEGISPLEEDEQTACVDADSRKILRLRNTLKTELAELKLTDAPLSEKSTAKSSTLSTEIRRIEERFCTIFAEQLVGDEGDSMGARNEDEPCSSFTMADYLLNKKEKQLLDIKLRNRETKIVELIRQTDALRAELDVKKLELKKSSNLLNSLKKKNETVQEEQRKALTSFKETKFKYHLANLKVVEMNKKLHASEKMVKRLQDGPVQSAKKQRAELKILKKFKRRGEFHVAKLSEAVDILRRKKFLSDEFSKTLSSLPAMAQSILERVSKKANGTLSNGEVYGPEIRRFAITLSFYSRSGYEFVRSCFRNCLPGESTIRGWFSKIEAEPGFKGEAMELIKTRARQLKDQGKQLRVSLVGDEIAIREHLEYNGKKTEGYIDMGDGAPYCKDTPKANYALTFMVVSLKDRLRIPCGYFLIKSMDSDLRYNTYKEGIMALEKIDCLVENLTFDGPKVNATLARKLGAEVDDYKNMVPSFPNPADPTRRINITFDACHMLKLIRNCLASKKAFFDADGGMIKWDYIVQLHNLQDALGVRFANRISKRHIQWQRAKMNVRLAAQTFSESVAKAIEYCRDYRKNKQFKGSEATVKFIRMVNKTFDILNSSNMLAKGAKQPLKTSNKSDWTSFFDEAEKYFSGLRTHFKKEHVNNKLLIHTLRKRGFLGFILCMRSAKEIFERLVEKYKELDYLLTYKLSQDHIEIFFGKIRRRCGNCRNPTCRVFKAAYKRLVVQNEVRASKNSNATDMFDFDIFKVSCKNRPVQGFDLCDCAGIESLLPEGLDTFFAEEIKSLMPKKKLDALFTDSSVMTKLMQQHDYVGFCEMDVNVSCISEYIAGFVVKKMKTKLECQECALALEGTKEDLARYSLVEAKQRGGLQIPSPSVVKVCKMTEKIYRNYSGKNLNYLLSQNIPLKASMAVREMNVFCDLDDHVMELDPLNCHVPELCKAIAQVYLNIRVYHEAGQENLRKGASERPNASRNLINKFQ